VGARGPPPPRGLRRRGGPAAPRRRPRARAGTGALLSTATATRTPPRADRAGALLPAAVGLGAAAVSAAGSWVPSLWTDEAATISAAQRSPAQLWRLVQSVDAVHGVYYALMHAWVAAFGASAVSLRLPSALAVGVAAAGVLVLGRQLTDDRAAALTGAVAFALLPRVTWAGLEARSSALTAAAAVWCTVALLRALRRRRPAAWTAYGALAAVGTALDVYLALLLLAHGVTLLLRRGTPGRDRVTWALTAGAALVLAGPVLLTASRQDGQLGDRGVGVARLAAGAVVSQWFLGETPTAASGRSAAATGLGRWWLPAAVALAALGWLLVVRGLAGRPRGGPPPAEPAPAWLLPWIVVPTALVGVQTLATSGSLYNPRYFAFGAPAVALAVALGLRRLPGRARVAAATAAVLLAVPVYASQRQVNAKDASDWSQAAQQLCRSARPGDAVYFSPRRPPVDGVTTLTTRGVAVAYPRCFAGLRDVTLLSSPEQTGDLTGTSRPLAAARDALAGADVVWVLRRPSDPSAAADEALLASAGLHRASTWQGPLDEVLRFTRG